MHHKTCMFKSVVCAYVAVLMTLAFVENASARMFWLKICGKWRTEYADAYMGDAVKGNGETDYPAKHASIWFEGEWHVPNYTGCTDYIQVDTEEVYTPYICTRFVRDNNRVYYAQPLQNGTETPNFKNKFACFGFYYYPSNFSLGQQVTEPFIVTHGYYSKIGPTIGQMMAKANALDIPANASFRVVAGDQMGVGYADDLNVKLRYNPASTDPNHKFPGAHELAGHPNGDLPVKSGGASVFMHGSNCGVEDSRDLCKCYGGHSHCLQSHEKIRCAEFEGWAHFIAAVLFNNRNQGDGEFGAYRDTLFPPGNIPADVVTFPWSLDLYDSVKWDETYCNVGPPSYAPQPDRGTEWDWLTFFWQLWDSGEKINISQIHDIWPVEGSGGSSVYWSNIDSNAANILNIDELDHFRDMADNNGVDH